MTIHRMPVLIMLSMSLAAAAAVAQSSTEWPRWASVPGLARSGDHEKALSALLSDPAPSDPVYSYNVGTLYFVLKQYGKAVAYLEKANRVSPHDADIQANLRIAREGFSRISNPERSDPASTGLEKVFDRVAAEEMRALVGVCAFLGCLLLLFRYGRTRSLARALRSPAGSIAAALLVLAGLVYAGKRYGDANPPAFCLETETARSGPGQEFLELARIEAGTKIRLTGMTAPSSDSEGPAIWSQVRFASGRVGWLPGSSLLPL